MLLEPCVIGTGQLLDEFEAFGLNSCYIIELSAAAVGSCAQMSSHRARRLWGAELRLG